VERFSARDLIVVGPSPTGWVRVDGVEPGWEPPPGPVADRRSSTAVLRVKLAGGVAEGLSSTQIAACHWWP
jgi:hypothetical protein